MLFLTVVALVRYIVIVLGNKLKNNKFEIVLYNINKMNDPVVNRKKMAKCIVYRVAAVYLSYF